MKAIASADNPAFKDWLKLAQRPREQRAQRRTLAEGIHLAQSALAAGIGVYSWLLRRGASGAELDALVQVLQSFAPGYELAPPLYDRLSPAEHGAGLMLVIPVRDDPLPQRSRQDLIYLDGIQDPGNVGTLLRTAAAAGIGDALLGPGCAAAWSPKALRAGMGAQFRMRAHEGVDPAALGATLDGDWIACVAHDASPLWRAELPRRAAGFVFGSEGQGISAAALACCAQQLQIPVAAVESLNVAAAAAIVLFERQRRRAE